MKNYNFDIPQFPHDHCSSFFQFLSTHRPEFTPASRWSQPILQQPSAFEFSGTSRPSPLTHGTTVLAFKYDQGVVIAGDRRATEGFQIAENRMEKVFKTDDYSAMAIAGAAGPCVEMAKLFSIELEHYEKLDGVQLSCEGKANRLGQMVKANLPLVMQGLVVIPLFVGYDIKRSLGRIFKYDITGGRYEETEFHSVGSGGKDARLLLKERFKKNLDEQAAIRIALLALANAADEDVGTGGPDPIRRIYPTMKFVNTQGVQDVEEVTLSTVWEELSLTRTKEH
ncbi:MAG: proteasome subunit beta [Nitrospirales bacterium]|nr:MAG: proteasome subunit beta [Nitrospirales bacterium]